MAAFLGNKWFDRARALVDGCGGDPTISYRVQFDAGDGGRWHQVVEAGVITAWGPGDVADPDVVIHVPFDVAKRVHTHTIDGTTAIAACSVADSAGQLGPVSPLDIEATGVLYRLPEMVGATLLVQYHYSDGPFGTTSFWWQFTDGRSDAMAWGAKSDPDVTVFIPYHHMVAVRDGSISIYEALEGGRVDGAVGPLMLLAGLQESPELHAAELACGPSGAALAKLGRLTAGVGHRGALELLAKETT